MARRSLEEQLRDWGSPEPWSAFQIVTVHALADQPELLQKLNMTPDECDSVGVHWLYKGHLYFLTLWNAPDVPGAFCWLHPYVKHNVSFNVRTQRRPITTTMLETALVRLALWIDNEKPSTKLTTKPVLIIAGDILKDA